MPDKLNSDEAIGRIVEALEDQAESLGAVGDFFAALDVALQEYRDTDKITLAGLVHGYRQAANDLEREGEGEPQV